ncbi:MAG TPA: hypothetical protein PLM53_09705 [Spirochaetota bacterium]|nr:hypothetical protein [Spirochaetota bacterium]HQF08647.1 hypothetical protein [Spirochaetota bacterium]HQH97362.1 hypothetical protein [Spirochaetota bacterium]HQJ70873.1 hypothetical protein [Spirochaetota bacterium]HRS77161.1 hypothetical protein [Spirochaetota bacterium]
MLFCGYRVVGDYYFYPGITGGSGINLTVLTATIRLTPEMQKALDGADFYGIRCSIGGDPVTLEAAPGQLGALRQFFRAGRP